MKTTLIVVSLVIHVFMYFVSIRRNSIYLLIVNSAMLVLVTGQGVFYAFYARGASIYQTLFYTITKSGELSAWFLWDHILLAFTCVVFAIFEFPSAEYQERMTPPICHRPLYESSFRDTVKILIIGIPVIWYLLRVVGGPSALLFGIRPTNVTGATLPLLILLGTKYSILDSLLLNTRPRWYQYAVSLLVVLLYFMSGTRIMAGLYALGIMITFAYSRRLQLSPKYILMFLVLAFGALIVMQSLKLLLYRDLDMATAIMETLETFYRAQVEGFTGLAGFASEMIDGRFHADGGLALYAVPIRFIPGSLRTAFSDIEKFLTSAYPYQKSIVPPGPQVFYAHFGWIGAIVYSIFLSVPLFIERRITHDIDASFFHHLGIIIITYSALLIRGSLIHFFFYVSADTVFSLLFFRPIIRFHAFPKLRSAS